jgi:hypothetical protein
MDVYFTFRETDCLVQIKEKITKCLVHEFAHSAFMYDNFDESAAVLQKNNNWTGMVNVITDIKLNHRYDLFIILLFISVLDDKTYKISKDTNLYVIYDGKKHFNRDLFKLYAPCFLQMSVLDISQQPSQFENISPTDDDDFYHEMILVNKLSYNFCQRMSIPLAGINKKEVTELCEYFGLRTNDKTNPRDELRTHINNCDIKNRLMFLFNKMDLLHTIMKYDESQHILCGLTWLKTFLKDIGRPVCYIFIAQYNNYCVIHSKKNDKWTIVHKKACITNPNNKETPVYLNKPDELDTNAAAFLFDIFSETMNGVSDPFIKCRVAIGVSGEDETAYATGVVHKSNIQKKAKVVFIDELALLFTYKTLLLDVGTCYLLHCNYGELYLLHAGKLLNYQRSVYSLRDAECIKKIYYDYSEQFKNSLFTYLKLAAGEKSRFDQLMRNHIFPDDSINDIIAELQIKFNVGLTDDNDDKQVNNVIEQFKNKLDIDLKTHARQHKIYLITDDIKYTDVLFAQINAYEKLDGFYKQNVDALRVSHILHTPKPCPEPEEYPVNKYLIGKMVECVRDNFTQNMMKYFRLSYHNDIDNEFVKQNQNKIFRFIKPKKDVFFPYLWPSIENQYNPIRASRDLAKCDCCFLS